MDKSFLNKGIMIKYFQFMIFIEKLNNFYYGIIPEDNKNIILYHVNPNYLYEFIINKINLMQKGYFY